MAIYTRIQINDLKKIAAPYGIEVIDFKPIEGGNANSNYYIQAKEGEYVLTISEENSLEEVLIHANLLQWFEKHGYLTCQVQATTSGELISQYNGKPIMVKKWIPGTVHENFTAEMLEQIGRSIAQMHQIPAPEYLPSQHPYGIQVFSSVIGKAIDSEYENWLEDRLHFLRDNLPDNLPKGLIHGDIFFDNVVFERTELKAIIDFEGACRYYLVFDLGMGILGLCRTEGIIDLTKVKALIKGYEQIRPMEIPEKRFIPFFIEYAAIATSYWRYWKYNIYSPNPDRSGKHREMVQVAKSVSKLSIYEKIGL